MLDRYMWEKFMTSGDIADYLVYCELGGDEEMTAKADGEKGICTRTDAVNL